MLKVVKKDELISKTNLFAMLDYIKTILVKVSFDVKLFEKELKKALKSLVKEEIVELKDWCFKKFGSSHEQVLQKCFVRY